jgi:hypothetical protein
LSQCGALDTDLLWSFPFFLRRRESGADVERCRPHEGVINVHGEGSAALKMEASLISRNTFSTSSLRGFTPLLTSQRGSYISFLKITHQFSQRSPRRLYAYYSQPPSPLLLPKGVVKNSEGNVAKDDCATEPSTTAAKPETSAGMSPMEGFQRASSSNDVPFKNMQRRSASGRQWKAESICCAGPKEVVFRGRRVRLHVGSVG